jgi:hypothetical protein
MRHWTYMHIFRHIFLSNYWWQKSDIWSQASYRYPISWEAFLDPSDSYFLFAYFVDFYKKCMFNVYKNQQSQQTGSRNLTGPKTLPTIWGTYMQLVTKYQISAINSYWEKCDEKYLGWTERRTEVKQHIEHICTFFVTFFSATIDGRDMIFGHKLHIGTPYRGKRFWTHQIPTSCFADFVDFYTHLRLNKMNCEHYDTPALRQTGSRNLMGPKTLPTIWGIYNFHDHIISLRGEV